LEELLAECFEKLNEMSLCGISTFHSMAERMKMPFSSPTAIQSRNPTSGYQTLYKSSTTSIADICQPLQPMKFTLTQNEFHMAASSLFERSNLTESNRIIHSLDLTATGINAVDMVKVFICMTKIWDL